MSSSPTNHRDPHDILQNLLTTNRKYFLGTTGYIYAPYWYLSNEQAKELVRLLERTLKTSRPSELHDRLPETVSAFQLQYKNEIDPRFFRRDQESAEQSSSEEESTEEESSQGTSSGQESDSLEEED